MATLNTDIRYIKGVGEARAKSLAKLGITDLRSLLSYFPVPTKIAAPTKKSPTSSRRECLCLRRHRGRAQALAHSQGARPRQAPRRRRDRRARAHLFQPILPQKYIPHRRNLCILWPRRGYAPPPTDDQSPLRARGRASAHGAHHAHLPAHRGRQPVDAL